MENGGDTVLRIPGSVGEALKLLFEVVLALFRPVWHFIQQVSEESWLGLALVFVIFFSLMLIRMGARTGKGIGLYADGLEYVGTRGLLLSVALIALLALEWMLMPPLTILLSAVANSMTGGEPGLAELTSFLSSPSPARTAFLGDVRAVYRSGDSVLPIGPRSAGLIAVAFGCMVLVARGVARWRGHASG